MSTKLLKGIPLKTTYDVRVVCKTNAEASVVKKSYL
jgi:hypothetical protein